MPPATGEYFLQVRPARQIPVRRSLLRQSFRKSKPDCPCKFLSSTCRLQSICNGGGRPTPGKKYTLRDVQDASDAPNMQKTGRNGPHPILNFTFTLRVLAATGTRECCDEIFEFAHAAHHGAPASSCLFVLCS